MILTTITVGDVIEKAQKWFNLPDEIANLTLVLEEEKLDPKKCVVDYSPNIFTNACKLLVARQPSLSKITVSINSSQEQELEADLNFS